MPFAEWVCNLASTPPQVAAPPLPNGGNRIIRTTTRRRHAASQLLMLQNPHRQQCGGLRRDLIDLAAAPVGSGRPATGDSDDAEATQYSPTKNRAGPLPVQDSPCTSHTAPLPVQNSPSTPLLTACAVQNSPCSPKMAQFGTFFACMANFLPFSPARSRAWRTLYRMRGRDGASHNSTSALTGAEGTAGTGGPGCNARGQRRHHRQPNFACNSFGRSFNNV